MYRLRHSLRLLVLLLTLSLGVGGQLFGQYYPVHATIQWPSPQSPHLVDYYSGSRDRLIITLHNRDLQQPLLLARLRLQIKSNGFLAQTREELSYPQLELMAGVPTRLTATDLMPYLRPESLLINGRLRNGQFPTGFTEISVQVVDYYSQQVLSSWHTARAYLDSKQPPMLNLPQRDEQVGYRDPLFIRFQWYPRHQGLAGTEYEFVLKELPDNGAAPQAAFAYGNEIYRTRTRHTTLNYTHLEPILLPNRRYAWQVQAIARDGVDELGLFEHGGFSEIYWFTLNENCPVPTGLKADPRYAKVDFSWNRVVGATGYMLACRPKTSKDIYEWSEVQSYGERMTLAQLKPGWTYEWRVGTLCTGDKPIYSAIQEVTLPKSNVDLLRDCGKEPPRPNLSPDPALDIQVGDTVTIGGDYPMVITQLQSLGDGWYSGRGTTRLSSIIELPRVALRFDRLRINIEKCQIDGLVEAIYADQPGGIADLDKIDDGGKRVQPSKLRIRERKVDFALGEMPEMSFDPETGELEVTDAEGKPQRIKLDLPEGGASASAFPMIITDSKGDSYQLSPDESSEVSSSGGSGTSSSEGGVGTKQGLKVERVERIGSFDASRLAHGIGTVRFEPSAQARYAFDSGTEPWYQGSVKLDEYYKPFAKDYIAPWKLIPVGEQDVVAARYEGKKAIDLSRVRFATSPDSPTLPAELHEESKTWSLKLPGTDAQSSYDVFAIYEGQVIGKLRVVSYPKQSYRVRLVSVNGQRVGDVSELSQHLNNIYQQVGVEFRLSETDAFQAELSNGHIRQDLKKLRDSYEEQHPLGKDEVCVFVLSSELSKSSKLEDVEGLMPRKSRFGYIFTGNSPNGKSLARTLAHELGHGLFTLQHSFDDEYGGKKSQDETANLMDYTVGATELVAFQWNIISNPALFTALDRDKDAQINRETKRVHISNEASECLAKKPVFAPNGRLFLLPKGATIYSIACGDASLEQVPLGAVITFTWKEEVYRSIYSTNREEFVLYRNDRGEPFIPEWIESGTPPELRFDYDKCLLFIDSASFPIDCSSCAQSHVQIDSSIIEISKATEGLLRYAIALRHKEGKTIEDNQLSSNKEVISLLKAEVAKALSKTPNLQRLSSRLQDKLQAYEQINGRRFIVVTCSIPYVSKSVEEWSALASRVFNESGLGDKDILITIPYIELPGLLRSTGSPFYMPGVARGTQAVIAPLSGRFDNSKYQASKNQAGMEDFILEVFRQTRKKVTLYKGYFSASRSITVVADHKGGKELSGYPYNRAIIPYIQKGSDQLINVVQIYQARESARSNILGATDGKITPEGYGHDDNQKWLERNYWPVFFKLAEYADQFDQYEPYTVSDPIRYRESFLDADNGKGLKNYEAYLLQYAYENVLKKLNLNLRSGFYFKQEHALTDKTDWFLTRYVDEPVYAVLDGASIVLAFIGLDAVPDALNVFYSTIRGDYSNASFAGISIILPGSISSKPVKTAGEYINKHLFGLIRDNAKVSIKAISKEAIERGSKQLARGATNEALERLLKSDTRGALRVVPHRDIVDAQELLIRSGHPKLAQQVDALRVVVDIRNHRNFKAFGLTDELLGRIASTINTDGYAQIVSNLRVLIDKFAPNKIKGLELLVNNLGHTESSFREGAEWTLRYLANNADEFTGASKVSFEVQEILPNGRKRIADMVVEYPQGGKVYYEFKSVKSLPPKDFIQQFSNDLTRPNFNIDMENLRWVFDGRKISPKDLQKLRKALEGIKEVKQQASKLKLRETEFIDIVLAQVFIVK